MSRSAFESPLLRGERLAARGDLQRAAESFAAALQQNPSSAGALVWLARLALLGEARSEAGTLLARLLEVEPDHPDGLALLAALQLDESDPAAGATAQRALVADPCCALAWGVAARACERSGDSEQAEAAARRAIELEPRDFESRYLLAQLAVSAGRGGEAVDHLMDALEVNPRFLKAYLTLGDLFTRIGEAGLARRVYAEGSTHLSDVEAVRQLLAEIPEASGTATGA